MTGPEDMSMSGFILSNNTSPGILVLPSSSEAHFWESQGFVDS